MSVAKAKLVLMGALLFLCASVYAADSPSPAPPPEVKSSETCVIDPARTSAKLRANYVDQAWATRNALFLQACHESNGAIVDSTDPTLANRLVRPDGISAHNIEEFYPPEARRAGLAGWVDLVFVVQIDGSVSDITPLQGAEVFLQAAIAAMKTAKYRRPAYLDGKPVRSLVYTRVKFSER